MIFGQHSYAAIAYSATAHTNFVVHAALQLSHRSPALLLLHLWVIV